MNMVNGIKCNARTLVTGSSQGRTNAQMPLKMNGALMK